MTSVNLKERLLQEIKRQLTAELETLTRSYEAALMAAVDTESKPENKYDTRSLEASYLASAQTARALELKAKLRLVDAVSADLLAPRIQVGQLSLVDVISQEKKQRFFLFDPSAGLTLRDDGITVSCLSALSPVGAALLNKAQGEYFSVGDDANQREYQVDRIQ